MEYGMAIGAHPPVGGILPAATTNAAVATSDALD
jgi:hypothetical protein